MEQLEGYSGISQNSNPENIVGSPANYGLHVDTAHVSKEKNNKIIFLILSALFFLLVSID